METNVFGEPLQPCSLSPKTGYYRDGSCHTGPEDRGIHTVCAIMTEEFLKFSKEMGNDLSTVRHHLGFPGLKPGDRWCICLDRWIEAYHAGKAPKVVLEATHEKTLSEIPLEELIKFADK